MVDYERIEKDTYEKIWSAQQGIFSDDSASYFRSQPSSTLLDFLSYLEEMGVSGGSVLDVGCGNARNAIAFAERGFEAHGIDIAEEALKMARKNVSQHGATVELVNGSVLSLPYPDDYFNAVIDFGCLHHLRKSQWGRYLRNLRRVLKGGGYYYLFGFSIDTPYIPGERRPKCHARNWVTGRKGHHCHYFSNEEVHAFFGRYFNILKEYNWDKDDHPERMKVFYMQRRGENRG